MLRWFATLLVAGCSFAPSANGSDGPPPGSDAGADAPAEGCFGTIVTVCPVDLPTGPQMFDTSTTIDTDGSSCGATDPAIDACVIAGTEVGIAGGATVRATGSRPLVLLATGGLTIDGRIDVASRRGGGPGAGANPAACVLGSAPSNGTTIAFGGGHGGTFGASGGDGGPADPDGNGGVAPAAVAFAFHGGCPGQPGGNSLGQGGSGGGAVALIATSIQIGGAIHASGAGGDGTGVEGAGGSGGGSGGAVVLDAATIDVVTSGIVLAHGGGGGEGSGGNVSDPGDDPTDSTAAVGGSGNSDGGDGGTGGTTGAGAVGSPPSTNPAGPSGGGGGGGGCGVIRATATPTVTGTVSPPAT